MGKNLQVIPPHITNLKLLFNNYTATKGRVTPLCKEISALLLKFVNNQKKYSVKIS